MARVRLIKKFAEAIDGIDLSGHGAGDVLELDPSEAALLLAEGWAVPERRAENREHARQYTSTDRLSNSRTADVAADKPRRRPKR